MDLKALLWGFAWLSFEFKFVQTLLQWRKQPTFPANKSQTHMMLCIASMINVNISERIFRLAFDGMYLKCMIVTLITHLNFPMLTIPYILRGMHILFSESECQIKGCVRVISRCSQMLFVFFLSIIVVDVWLYNQKILHQYSWTETLNAERKCQPNVLHFQIVGLYILFAIVSSGFLQHRLRKLHGKVAVSVQEEYHVFFLSNIFLNVSAACYVKAQSIFKLNFPFTAYCIICTNLLLFYFSFMRHKD